MMYCKGTEGLAGIHTTVLKLIDRTKSTALLATFETMASVHFVSDVHTTNNSWNKRNTEHHGCVFDQSWQNAEVLLTSLAGEAAANIRLNTILFGLQNYRD